MKYLLDTSIFLWFLDADKRLSSEFREIIENDDNIKFISVASVWEIVIKVSLGKLPGLKVSAKEILKQLNFQTLDIELSHVLEVTNLPKIHKDPFDRIIISQAKVEGLILLTSDKKVMKYFGK